jgi:DNA-binding XRE family transcriptional regulator
MLGPSKLKAWRAGREKKTSIAEAARLLRVTHPTWHDWEKGKKTPDLCNAFDLENLTDGDVRIEDWGYAKAANAARAVIVRRLESEAA